MKTILGLILIISLASCSKDDSLRTCYDCKYALTNGVQRPDDVICTDNGEPPPPVIDALGNHIGGFCTKR